MASTVRTPTTNEQEAAAPVYELGSVPPAVEKEAEVENDKGTNGLPPPPTQEAVDHFGALTREPSTAATLGRAVTKLEAGLKGASTIDWDATLYMLMLAWIVNFGLEANDPPAPPTAIEVPDLTTGVAYGRQNDAFVPAAANHLNLKWIPFVDLALAPWKAGDGSPSGPYGGVFVHEGENPFLVLAFKGTTFDIEVKTDTAGTAIKIDTPPGAIYGAQTHQGMAQGLFMPFTYTGYSKPTFDLIWDRLQGVAAGLNKPNLPVYVTGHSLGAGYAAQAFVELVRRHTPARSYDIKDLYTFGGPRMFNKGADPTPLQPQGVVGIREVQAAIEASGRKVWRVANFKDVVPNLPTIIGLTSYKHLSTGYKTFPDPDPSFVDQYVEIRPSEVPLGNSWDNDKYPGWPNPIPSPAWVWHWPERYYESLMKIINKPT